MKRLVLALLLLGSLAACRLFEAEPKEQAAIIEYYDYSKCGFCGGWFVKVGEARYRAEVPPPYDQNNTLVWIRYRPDERPRAWICGEI
ncbi:hypothetical protein GCM10027275_14770 [Rhabdobacter roseus]|uniref:Uncharacterized protein n=1 Tax=Rhabdobacter roseus TaxID=1655419 RepID=A0A840TNR7_9BACT|nr:hypothetical protein [Rhabdobacter roseus]MBB5283397.1 hypothetical protein [Rhabdobacter roseus]